METPFVWFDVRAKDADKSRSFYEQLFGWDIADVPAGDATLTTIGGEKPWASVVPHGGDHLGWFPYVQVEDLDAATTMRAFSEGERSTSSSHRWKEIS